MKYRMYDKEKINKLAMEFVNTGNGFNELLEVLEPMVQKILLRYPKYEEHHEDLKQTVLLKIFQRMNDAEKMKPRFTKNVPSDYLFFRIKDYIRTAIAGIDSRFNPRKPKERKELVSKGKKKMKTTGYDMYDEVLVSFQDLTPKERIELGLDDVESNGEYWE